MHCTVCRPHLPAALALLVASAIGCNGGLIDGHADHGDDGLSSDAGLVNDHLSLDGGALDDAEIQPNWDAFFADDPPPQYCGPDGGWQPPPLPGGTPDCPDDKNREGCPCTQQGKTAPCWPGLRKNRDRGICKDGVTTCQLEGEHHLRWGPCQGYLLPEPGATKGPAACNCFSAGQWQIDNLSPCFVTYLTGATYAVSTYVNGAGQVACPAITSDNPPPQPQAGEPWSTSSLTVDCAGTFTLCFTIKSGDFDNPSPSDCVLAEACTSAWYAQKNTPQELPPLPAWSSNDPACAAAFNQVGGYGEMSVVGESIECEPINDNGQPLVFHRVKYCPMICAQNPSLPACAACGNGTSGSF